MEVMSGSGSWWDSIVNAVTGTAALLDSLWDTLRATMIQRLTSLFGNPPTAVNYAEHRLRIDNYVLEGKKMVFLAHSQGNLFVNPAADYARGKSSAAAVKVVHVAPASPTLRGGHVLADLDLVINGLRAVGSVPPVTHSIPGYLLRPAGLNGQKDPLGHGLLEIYLNPALNVSSAVRGLVQAALNDVQAPPAQATSGFFTATVTWDGSGDVDTHVYEPGGAHVWYQQLTGQAGYLDHDNTVGFGPEHYYASCETSKLQVGTYAVKLANYNAADGRTATVQIASSKDGVLATRSAVMGGATRNTPTFQMFNVIVSKDPDTGEYKVDVQ
ncbi:hypothetical protein CDN99_12940 [Roseateles aquatilis]|uniref:DUF2135 domain-containing protein n=2 Tax=Roseateles aquatilis TaxID=431061 RepID=A0A246JD08_9BURK|nr:hypothetical protein CDN99_12940 [Roseateles aquatilis]